jgi:hypothetical protein
MKMPFDENVYLDWALAKQPTYRECAEHGYSQAQAEITALTEERDRLLRVVEQAVEYMEISGTSVGVNQALVDSAKVPDLAAFLRNQGAERREGEPNETK